MGDRARRASLASVKAAVQSLQEGLPEDGELPSTASSDGEKRSVGRNSPMLFR